MRHLVLVVALVVSVSAAVAQHSPYTSLTGREIKALSDDDIRKLREGQGMGLALAAELNGYPGPKHVLELADKLALSDEQRSRAQAIYDTMHKSAVALGAEIIDMERQLDQAFAQSRIDAKKLAELSVAIGERQGRLRNVHLVAHIETKAVLTRHQIHLYEQARGYGSGTAGHQHH
jgi:hypothetical protein